MSLINSSYFQGGQRPIPNINHSDQLTVVNQMISLYEPEYLKRALGYELYLAFKSGIVEPSPNQRYVDILLGKDFRGSDGILKRWPGFVSVTDAQPSISISTSNLADIYFTVGVTQGAPADGTDTYSNPSLAGKSYRVTQRGYGPLEALKEDNSNVGVADIEKLPDGGFKWRNGTLFSLNDKYTITFDAISFDVSNVAVVPFPESPIADYVYYHWLKFTHTQATANGVVQTKNENSIPATPKYKACDAWNSMATKTALLREFLIVNAPNYPEYEHHSYSEEVYCLLKKIHPYY